MNKKKKPSQDKEVNSKLVKSEITIDDIKGELSKFSSPLPTNHKEILKRLLNYIHVIDFRKYVETLDENEKLGKRHYVVGTVQIILELAVAYNWGLCKNSDFIYLFNECYWNSLDANEFQKFLAEAAEKMGVEKFEAKHYPFSEQLFKQFLFAAHLPTPEQPHDKVFINLKNGTFEISSEKQELRQPNREDFITYQLPFDYDQNAQAPLFKKYLDKVVPDLELQKILAEYLGYLFIRPSILKLEKTLLLKGTGANGKSVFFEIVFALLGGENNVSNYSLQSLTTDKNYCRAMLANKLLNYASEINGKLEASVFKQLVSGEPVEARLIYGKPFTLRNYAKLIFNCNELPKEVEQTNAFFRRFLIVPFDVVIPEEEQDKELSKKIIDSELSGVLNWVLEGLNRLLTQKNFTESQLVKDQLSEYQKQSDSVQMFLEEEGFEKSIGDICLLKKLYTKYQEYCDENGCRVCSKKTFAERLRKIGYETAKKNIGMVVYIKSVSK
jgi:putative DNA primase/helicase